MLLDYKPLRARISCFIPLKHCTHLLNYINTFYKMNLSSCCEILPCLLVCINILQHVSLRRFGHRGFCGNLVVRVSQTPWRIRLCQRGEKGPRDFTLVWMFGFFVVFLFLKIINHVVFSSMFYGGDAGSLVSWDIQWVFHVLAPFPL